MLFLQRFGFLEQFSRVTLQSVTYTSESWAVPASGVWLGGELELTQIAPLPASGTVDQYNESPVNSSGTEGVDIADILSRYNERNGEFFNSWSRIAVSKAWIIKHPYSTIYPLKAVTPLFTSSITLRTFREL